MKNFFYHETTGAIIGAFYCVYNNLGYGFLEKVYKNSLMIELEARSLRVVSETPINVQYKGNAVGNYYCDIFVNHTVIVEVKAVELLLKAHELQLMNYLRATQVEVGLLLNFGPKPEFKRRIFFKNPLTSV